MTSVRTRAWLVKDTAARLWPERLLVAIVWKLPERVVYWSVVRAACKAEPNEYPGAATAEQMLKAMGR